MRDPKHHLAKLDPVWERIRQEAEQSIQREALLGGFMHQIILQHSDIEAALSHSLAQKLASAQMSEHCLLYTSPSPRDRTRSRMPSSA